MRVAFRTSVVAVGVAAAMVLTASGAAAKGEPRASAGMPAPAVPVLGVLNAGGGTFDGHRLTLTKVQRTGVWFTDRPARQAGTGTVAALVTRFFRGQDPPNAAIEIENAPVGRDVAIVELSKPKYDKKSARLSFAAKVIRQVSAARAARHPSLVRFEDRNDGKLSKRFGSLAMFLDASAPSNQTPDDVEIAQLETRFQTLTSQTTTLVDDVNAIIKRDLQSCWITFERAVISDLYEAQPPIARNLVILNDALLDNKGELPASDDARLASTKSMLSALEATYTRMESAYADAVKTTACPATG
jgi:hypothetical protein